MWTTLLPVLRCPICRGTLVLEPFEPAHVGRASKQWVDTGILLCRACRFWFPIFRGVPVLLPYRTRLHDELGRAHSERFGAAVTGFAAPSLDPNPGELFVRHSFSEEWLGYTYDGTIWDLSYRDHEARFLAEVGPPRPCSYLLEVGCGMGISTEIAQRHCGGDAIGVDLSLAVFRAAEHFADNRHLHFVQASVFHLPLREGIADLVYTHGVLHHTYSTERAFRALARFCAPGGRFYVWVYGLGSMRDGVARKAAYLVERTIRPRISRSLSSPLSRAFLGASALGYLCVNAYHRARDPSVRRYTFSKALHAARDRFTPEFAHRHDAGEIRRWFEEEGFDQVEVVDWHAMPSANQANYRRNTGVRGVRIIG